MNIICKILGHKEIIRDWYSHDPITSLCCLRCNKVLKKQMNPTYTSTDSKYIFLLCKKSMPYGEMHHNIKAGEKYKFMVDTHRGRPEIYYYILGLDIDIWYCNQTYVKGFDYIWDYFYTSKEERKLKLEKLNHL